KAVSVRVGNATLTGIAKGVGMIEPNMATMLAWFFTDADLEQPVLDEVFRRVVERTFNALSIDTDTSTSDSAAIFANGLAGPVDPSAFEEALHKVALDLVRMIASDGEGAGKLIEVRMTGARDDAQAKRIAKAVVNSPLVKAAVHGADPNWGRVAMAVGKCSEEYDVLPENVRITFGEVETYPTDATDKTLERAAAHMAGDEVIIGVDLGIADGSFTVYGCDLTEGYIRINADYTTWSPAGTSGTAAARTARRACSGPSAASANSANRRHWSRVCRARAYRTAGNAAGTADRLVTPRPTRTGANSGSAAASPHTPTERPRCSPARPTTLTNSSTAACQGSNSSDRGPRVRSAAIVY